MAEEKKIVSGKPIHAVPPDGAVIRTVFDPEKVQGGYVPPSSPVVRQNPTTKPPTDESGK